MMQRELHLNFTRNSEVYHDYMSVEETNVIRLKGGIILADNNKNYL